MYPFSGSFASQVQSPSSMMGLSYNPASSAGNAMSNRLADRMAQMKAEQAQREQERQRQMQQQQEMQQMPQQQIQPGYNQFGQQQQLPPLAQQYNQQLQIPQGHMPGMEPQYQMPQQQQFAAQMSNMQQFGNPYTQMGMQFGDINQMQGFAQQPSYIGSNYQAPQFNFAGLGRGFF